MSTTLKSTISLGRWNGTQVVIKSSLGNEFDFTEELLHEIEVLSSLRHPDLVMFLGACLEPDQPIMCITEYLSGGDLERYYMKMQRDHETLWHPALQQVLQWSAAVARALAFLHNRRVPILHRDLQLGLKKHTCNMTCNMTYITATVFPYKRSIVGYHHLWKPPYHYV